MPLDNWQQLLATKIDPSQIRRHEASTYTLPGDTDSRTVTDPAFFTLEGVNFGMGDAPSASPYGALGGSNLPGAPGTTTYGNNNIIYRFDKDGNVIGGIVKVGDKEAYDVPFVNGAPEFSKAKMFQLDTNAGNIKLADAIRGTMFVLGAGGAMNWLSNAGYLGAGGTGASALSAAPMDLSHIYGSISSPGYALPATGVPVPAAPGVQSPGGDAFQGPPATAEEAILRAGDVPLAEANMSYGAQGNVPFTDKVANIGFNNALADTVEKAVSSGVSNAGGGNVAKSGVSSLVKSVAETLRISETAAQLLITAAPAALGLFADHDPQTVTSQSTVSPAQQGARDAIATAATGRLGEGMARDRSRSNTLADWSVLAAQTPSQYQMPQSVLGPQGIMGGYRPVRGMWG